MRELNRGRLPETEPLDFFIWTVEDVGLWLEEINLGGYRQFFKENGGNAEYHRPWWAPSCFSAVFTNTAKHNRQSRVVSQKLEP